MMIKNVTTSLLEMETLITKRLKAKMTQEIEIENIVCPGYSNISG